MQDIRIEIDKLTTGYKGKNTNKIVSENINLTALTGELIMLIGSNGAGKSTLLRTITALQQIIKGNININGKKLQKYSRQNLAKTISYVSTEVININNLNVFELISLGRFPYTNWFGILSKKDKYKIFNALENVGLYGFENKSVSELSDGEKQRVMIARTLAQDTDIIILDEPTAFLDMANKYATVNLLHQLADQHNKTIIFSIHDLNIAVKEADKIWLILPNGKIEEGAAEDLVLRNSFEKIFSKENNTPQNNLFFDKMNGDFRIRRKKKGTIKIISEPNIKEEWERWTKKAFERIGLFAENNADWKIKITTDKNVPEWKVIAPEEQEFKSLYQLITHFNKFL